MISAGYPDEDTAGRENLIFYQHAATKSPFPWQFLTYG